MRAGNLDRRIAFQVATSTQDSAGQPQFSWETFYECAAERIQEKGTESLQAQQPVAQDFRHYRLRYPSADIAAQITAAETVRLLEVVDGELQTRAYNITRVDDTFRRDGELHVYAYARAEAAA